MVTILKFGGSSVATADGMRQVAKIVSTYARKEQIIIVISAFRNVTDKLLECAHLAAIGDNNYKEIYHYIVDRHQAVLRELIDENSNPSVYKSLHKLSRDLYKVLHSTKYLRDQDVHVLDLVASFGEQLSAIIFASYLNTQFPAYFVDARQFIITDNHYTQAQVLYEESSIAIRRYFEHFFTQEGEYAVPVVTGFIGMTKENDTTTLGRDGSNCTAATLGAALDAKVIEIWSDVNGVYSADPKLIHTSIAHAALSYTEVEELSNFRVKVVRSVITPQVVTKNIPIVIKNTFNPNAPGTKISLHTKRHIIKNVSIMHELVLITLSTLMPNQLNVSHITERLFHTLAAAKINFTLITQISSAYDVCFSVNEMDIKETLHLIEIAFLYEHQQKLLTIKKIGNQSMIALIGDGIKQVLSAFGKILIALESKQIRLNGIAHGTAGCNISFVINANQSHKALEIIHHAVFEEDEPS
jgi:aspartokinase/homoserine dehydrogenase 1